MRDLQTSHHKVTTRTATKASELEQKNFRMERLQNDLKYTRGNYEEVLDEIESAGVGLTTARQEINRMDTDGRRIGLKKRRRNPGNCDFNWNLPTSNLWCFSSSGKEMPHVLNHWNIRSR